MTTVPVAWRSARRSLSSELGSPGLVPGQGQLAVGHINELGRPIRVGIGSELARRKPGAVFHGGQENLRVLVGCEITILIKDKGQGCCGLIENGGIPAEDSFEVVRDAGFRCPLSMAVETRSDL